MQDSEPIEQKALSRSESQFAILKKYFVTPKLFFKFMLLIVLLLFIIVTAVYVYFNTPLRSILATIKYEEYRQLQGIDYANIQSKNPEKNFKTGEVYLKVYYKDDPQFEYRYIYQLYCPSKEKLRTHDYHKMRLEVLWRDGEKEEGRSKPEAICKYPPLEANAENVDPYF